MDLPSLMHNTTNAMATVKWLRRTTQLPTCSPSQRTIAIDLFLKTVLYTNFASTKQQTETLLNMFFLH